MWFTTTCLPQITIPLPFLNKLNFTFYNLSIILFRVDKTQGLPLYASQLFLLTFSVIVSSYKFYISYNLTGLCPSNMCYNFQAYGIIVQKILRTQKSFKVIFWFVSCSRKRMYLKMLSYFSNKSDFHIRTVKNQKNIER